MDPPDGINLGSGKWQVGVIADTHVDRLPFGLPHPMAEALSGSDLILHAGDIGSAQVVAELEEIAPVLAVRGNEPSDRAPCMGRLPHCRRLRIAGHTIVLIHGDLGVVGNLGATRSGRAVLIMRPIRRSLKKRAGVRKVLNGFLLAWLAARFQGRADCVVFGHTHIPTMSRLGPTLYVNPGDAQFCAQPVVHIAHLHVERWKPIRAELLSLELSR
jgi:predicted phosphodiesterase